MKIKNRPSVRRGGYALVIVLGIVALVTALMVGFLMRASTERSAAGGYAASVSSRQLADSAVSIVQAQINDATVLPAGNHVDGAGNNAWVSQPGMVRTFNNAGALVKAYKLYSSEEMVVQANLGASMAKDRPPAAGNNGWSTNPGLWTDLNAPVETKDQATGAQVKNYPIVDPGALDDIGSVKGLRPVALGGAGGFAIDATQVPVTTPVYNPAPMPVKWLYVLRNGAMVAPRYMDDKTVFIDGESKANNPVVGRIAFWADDESAKVNINTAGEQTYWSTPTTFTQQEVTGKIDPATGTMKYGYALSPPVVGEYQRFPGHPATVSLSALFPSGTLALSDYLALTPRYAFGGTKGATVELDPNGAPPNLTGISKTNRLYASVDEMVFQQTRIASNIQKNVLDSRRFFLTAHSRAPETTLFNTPRVAIWPIYEYNGGAPDMNYTTAYDRMIAFCSSTGNPGALQNYFFQRKNAYDSVYDMTINRNVDVYGYLQSLTDLLIPGYGGRSFSTKYPKDRDTILTCMFDYIRCTNLYDDHLAIGRQFTKAASTTGTSGAGDPGTGQVLPIRGPNGTHGMGRFPVIRQLDFVFIACADGSDQRTDKTLPVDEYHPSNNSNSTRDLSPAMNGGAKDALGNVILPPGVTVDGTYGKNLLLAEPFPEGPLKALTIDQTRVQAIVYPEFYMPMYGFRTTCPDVKVEITGLGTAQLGGSGAPVDLKFPNSGYAIGSYDPFAISGYSGRGGFISQAWILKRNGNGGGNKKLTTRPQFLVDVGYLNPLKPLGHSATDTPPFADQFRYPFISVPVTIDGSTMHTIDGITMQPGAPLNFTVNLYDGNTNLPNSGANNIAAIYNFQVPVMKMPVPKLTAYATDPQGVRYYPNLGMYFDGAGPVSSQSVAGALGSPQLNSDKSVTRDPSTSFGRMNINYSASSILSSSANTDVVRSILPLHGDYRVVAANYINSSATGYYPYWDNTGANYTATLTSTPGQGAPIITITGSSPTLGKSIDVYPRLAMEWGGPQNPADNTGDFDMSSGRATVGPYGNKPDEGDFQRQASTMGFTESIAGQTFAVPYYTDYNSQATGKPTFFSPNRMVSSPVMFGSIPTGAKATAVLNPTGWQTLLFRPLADYESSPKHPGAATPHDELLLDLFWMPVVEPYAISDRLSTAGKINMNYQIQPFNYIDRSAPMRAILKGEKVFRLPSLGASGKLDSASYSSGSNAIATDEFRRDINIEETLKQFTNRFNLPDQNKNVFISPAEICEQHLVPIDATGSTTLSNMSASWASYKATADNLRERTYADIYPRLTTKSNTFTVHFRAQTLKKSALGKDGQWAEGRDTLTSDYRGSTIIERFINPDAAIPDYAPTPTSKDTLDKFYKWRVIQNTQFAP